MNMLANPTLPSAPASDYALGELAKEARMGGQGQETRAREVRVIDISDFDRRKAEIADAIWQASVEIGFFQVSGHGIPQSDIDAAFGRAEQLFALPREVKAQWPLSRNAGWEHKAQIRPSTRTPDQKESYQVTRPRMTGLWPTQQELPGFQQATLDFERQCWQVGMQLLSCFAHKLGFDADFFTRAHDPSVPAYQSTLRMLHYFAVDPALKDELGLWRAGAHTDFDCLTLLFQHAGQGLPLMAAEAGFAGVLENGRDAGAGGIDDGLVDVHEVQREALGQAAADAGFAGAHRADQDQVRSRIHAL